MDDLVFSAVGRDKWALQTNKIEDEVLLSEFLFYSFYQLKNRCLKII